MHVPQRGQNTLNHFEMYMVLGSSFNQNLLAAAHKEEYKDAGKNLLREHLENELAGRIIVWKSRQEGGICGKRTGIKLLCFLSSQNWLLPLFKEPGR